ncbi:probable LRR receptor-like serine/threonine-protein kinase At1g53430 [Ricinus communis]|nr:probable LRR receptor-like serine/threonine-protein kinase At1g53430 [Ricinus communis]
MAPEYAMRGYLTYKADVYSFGVVALEIVSGKNGTSYRPNDESVYQLDLAYVLQEKGEFLSLVDPILGCDYSVKQATIILDLAMLCTNPSPTLRPTMSEVVKVLEGKSKIKAPSFHVPYWTDDFAMAKVVASLIPSIRSTTRNSMGKTSNAVSYDVVSRDEDEYDMDEDCSSVMLDKTNSLVN